MRRRVLFSLAALALWVAGTVAGSIGPGAPTPASALRALVIGRAHAGYTPALDGDEPIFILALGSDARPGTPIERGLADSIHVIAINPEGRRVSLLGLPRDSYVSIPGHGTSKINEAMALGGPQLMVKTVEQLTGITFDYFALTSFDGLQAAVDDIGGLTIEVLFPMHDQASKSDFDPGVHTLNGHDTLAFSRDRHSLISSDFGRSENQGRVLMAILTQLRKQFTKDPSVLFDYLGAGLRNVQTDLSTPEMLDLAFTALSIEPARVQNMVAAGSLGTAGTTSIVNLHGSNEALYKDLADDGIVRRKHVPPSPNAAQT